MPRELRIAATVEVPDDIFAGADKLASARPFVEAFREAVEAIGGEVSVDLVVPRPRADKGDAAAQYERLGGKMPE